MRPLLLLSACLLLTWQSYAQNFTIRGYVKEASSGEALIGATIVDKDKPGTGVVTNVYGFFSLTLPEGNYTLQTSFVGYQTQTTTVNLTENKSIEILLAPEEISLDEVVVSAEKVDANVTEVKMSRENLKIERIKSIPALMGEVDVIKSIQLLPGISSAGEGTTGMFVRGGSSDQNLILLDEATVYNASHLLGFFSVFNPDAVKNVEVYKGGIPARFGGRLSSILDIQMREGNNQQFEASGGIGTISSRLTAEGPLVKGKSSILVSGRRTYADIFLGLSNDENLQNNTLYFYDLNAKVNYTLSDKDKLYASAYVGRDKLGFNDLFGFDWGNVTTSLRWNHLFNDKLFLNTTALYSNFDYGFQVDASGQSFDWESGLKEFNLKLDFDYYINPKNTMSFGANSIYHIFSPVDIDSNDDITVSFSLDNDYAIENAVYWSNKQELSKKWSVEYGLRYSSFAKIGKDKVAIYEEGEPRTNETQVDSLLFGSGEVVKFYDGFEPRIGVRYLLNPSTSIKASYNRMRQYLQVASNSTAGFPTDRWIPADYYINPLIGDQVAIGYFKNFSQNTWELSVEGYYKWMQNVVDFLPGEDVLLNDNLETATAEGKAWSYGAEFLLRKNMGKTTGWLSYTLSHTQRQIDGVASGDPYNARYDKTHDISLIVSHQINDKLQLSGNWVYATGAAVTFPEGRYTIENRSVPYYDDSKRNTSRMPDYHRMDVALTLQLNSKSPKWDHELNFSIYNLYNRKNAFSIEFREVDNNDPGFDPDTDGPITDTRPAAVKTSLFGIIPSITYNFKFN